MKFEFLIGTVGLFVLSSVFVALGSKGGVVVEAPETPHRSVETAEKSEPVFLVPEKVSI